MEKFRQYNIEGIILNIPLHYDEKAKIYIEEYPDFIEAPVWTLEGNRVMFAGEDSCDYAEEAAPGGCVDCGACKYFCLAEEHTWIGVCRHEENKKYVSVSCDTKE